MRYVFNGEVSPKSEDGGQALIVEFDRSDLALFVRVQSWDETLVHPEMGALVGKTVRVTIEVIEP